MLVSLSSGGRDSALRFLAGGVLRIIFQLLQFWGILSLFVKSTVKTRVLIPGLVNRSWIDEFEFGGANNL